MLHVKTYSISYTILLTIAFYETTQESGKLESFIEKRRRKNASKDRRYMPYRRSSNTEEEG